MPRMAFFKSTRYKKMTELKAVETPLSLEVANILNPTQTMSSLEIAELTGKQHKNVLADIRNMLKELGIEGAEFSAPFKMPSGQKSTVYNLPRYECDILIAGYSIKYRAAIIKRWHEFEGEGKKPKTRLELAEEQVVLIRRLDCAEKEVQVVTIKLDENMEYASIKRMEKLHGKKFKWQSLKAASIVNGEDTRKDVFDANYGTVKGYHKDVWMQVYQVEVL